MEHWFWTIFCALMLLWYVAVTLIVAVKGGKNIREMIERWKAEAEE